MNADSWNTLAPKMSRLGQATSETEDLNSNLNHSLSRRRDGQIFEGAQSKEESERRNDANCEAKVSVNATLDAIEEDDVTKETGHRSLVLNIGKDIYVPITSLPDSMSQPSRKPASPSTTQGSNTTTRPIAHTRNKKHTSHTLTRETTLTPSTSINISHNRNRFLQSTPQHGQVGPVGPSSKLAFPINAMALALNTVKTTARIQEDIISKQMRIHAESSNPHGSMFGQLTSDPTRTGEYAAASSPVNPKLDTPPVPLQTGTMSKVVPNTALGSRSTPLFASDTSKVSTIFRNIMKNKSLQKTTLLVSQNLKNTISTQTPPLFPQNFIQFSSKPPQHLTRASSKSPPPPVPHSSIDSPPCLNTIRETPLLAPPSPTLPIKNPVRDLLNHSSDDGFTSADAEGESIGGCDSLFEFIESVVDTPPTQSIETNSAILQSSNQASHKSVYDLFTPPLTRQSSEVSPRLAEHGSTPQRAPQSRLFMSYVDVPPLPKEVNKLEYRPLKRVKHTHGDEYFPENASPKSWGRERGVYGRNKYPRRESSARPVRSSSVLSLATTASSHVPRRRQTRQPTSTLSKPLAPSSMQMSRQASAAEGHINTMASVSTTYHSPFQRLPPMSRFPSPSPAELGIQDQRIHDAEHLSPVVTYFNTRHYRLGPEEDLTSWILLGAQILMKCLGPRRLSCVREMKLDDGDEIDDGNYSVGEPVYWEEGCSGGGEEEESSVSQLQKRQSKTASRSGLDVRKPKSSIGVQKRPSERSLGISVPKDQSTKGLEEKTSTMTSQRKSKRDMKKGRVAETAEMPVPAVSQSQSQGQPRSTAAVEEEQPKSRPYLSEKARGKLKAVDTDYFAESDFHGDLPSDTALSPTTAQGLLDVDALAPTVNSPTWPRSVEQYITFDVSPAKIGEGSNSHDDGYAPNFPCAPYDTAQFLSSRARMDDLFLPPHDVGPSIFNDGISIMEGIDAYHEPYGVLMNAEKAKEVELTTVDPTLLGGNTFDHAADEMGLTGGVMGLMEDTDGTEIEDQRVLVDVTTHSQQSLGIKAGYEPILGSPIVSAERSSSSSWNVSPRSSQPPSTPLQSRSISDAPLGRTSSPEFSDHYVSSQVHLSSLTKEPRAITRALSAASASRQDELVSSEDEEEEVRRGLEEYLDAFSTSDEDFIPVSDLENESEEVDRVRPPSLRPKRTLSVSSSAAPVLAGPIPAVTKNTRRGQEWECGPIRSCCHYCRTSSNKLKMVCPCGSRYCNRCMALHFPDIEFRSKWDSYQCPNCKDQCTCDLCTKKRGEVYVSRRRNKESSLQAASVITRPKRAAQPAVQASPLPQPTALPSPEAVESTENFSFWGSIYDMNGSKIAVGFADEDNKVVVANAIEGYARPKVDESASEDEEDEEDDLPISRIFVGAYQPSWGLGSSPVIKDLKGRRRRYPANDADEDDTDLQWYIGKKSLLYRSVVARSRDLPTNPFSDMSSLSSLSDDSDVEVDGNAPLPVVDKIISSIKDQNVNINKIDPDAIQARDTVHILQKIAQDVCGMMANVEQSLMNT